MASKVKDKSWFRKHPILRTLLGLLLIFIAIGWFINTNTTGDVVNEQNNQQEQQQLEEIKIDTDSSDDLLDDFNDDLDEALEDLEEQSSIYKKLDECTKLSAGKDINLPAIKNEFYTVCYEIYYYGGEEDLDKFIEELNGEQ